MAPQSDNENRLLARLDSVTDELAKKKMELRQSRTALENAHAIIAFLQKQCDQLIQIASESGADTQEISNITDSINSADDTDFLSSARIEAFGRGFEEGWVYSKTNANDFPSEEKERFSLYHSRVVSIWDATPRFSSLRFKKTKENHSLMRFGCSESGELMILNNGDFVKFHDYAELQFSFDCLKEELAGYQWILRTPDPINPGPNWKGEACRNKLRVRSNPGAIRIQYGFNDGERDLMVIYGSSIPRCDRALFLNMLTSKRMSFNYDSRMPRFENSMEDELLARGYDLSTLKFTIQKKL